MNTNTDRYTHLADDRAPAPSTLWRRLDGTRPNDDTAARTAPRKAAFLAALRETRIISTALEQCSIPSTTFDNWRKYDFVFRAEVELATGNNGENPQAVQARAKRAAFLDKLSKLGSVNAARSAMGVALKTYIGWRHDFPEFKQQVEQVVAAELDTRISHAKELILRHYKETGSFPTIEWLQDEMELASKSMTWNLLREMEERGDIVRVGVKYSKHGYTLPEVLEAMKSL